MKRPSSHPLRRPRWLLIVALAGCPLLSCHRQSATEKAAISVAQSWLAVTDAGGYPQSWSDGAGYMHRAVGQAQWEASMNKLRKPLGKVLARTLRSAKDGVTELYEQPCVRVKFDTSFENKSSALETVTVMPENDGQLKVAGYFIE